jgi:hypothetical protein
LLIVRLAFPAYFLLKRSKAEKVTSIFLYKHNYVDGVFY